MYRLTATPPRAETIPRRRRRLLAAAFLPACIAAAGAAWCGIVPPRDGGPLPQAFRELRLKDRRAFTMTYGWIERAARTRAARGGPLALGVETPGDVSGTLRVPVLAARFADEVDPVSVSGLGRVVFDGPSRYGTVTDYYEEVSRGRFSVTGEVDGWHRLLNGQSYYVGLFNGLDPVYSRTGEMIREAIDAADPAVDFGRFDNDGPDGVPNSGDDDGFVDVLVVVHSARGGECGGAGMWSHSWGYSNWNASGGEPYVTNDPAAGGGAVRIEDYIVAPSRSCDGGLIEISVFCHELGHTLGLPDLYDYNGGGVGIGHWGLMGSGNWNTPESPAHFCAWSKEQLGWVEPVPIGAEQREFVLAPVQEGGAVLRLDIHGVRFGRAPDPASPDNDALVCGYSGTEASYRDWPGGAGYGNGWRESVWRDFVCAPGDAPVLAYRCEVDLEEGYDFARLLVEGSGETDTLRVYTGETAVSEEIDLAPHLPAAGGSFRLRFEVTSDFNFSDEDGRYDSGPGAPFLVDDVLLTGLVSGDHACDFEEHACGWRGGDEPAEYFIVEHRRRVGFDRHLHGEGLLVWHAENSTAYTYLGNSGGFSNVQARGLVLEEADGRYDLLTGLNSGDAGDPFPGRTGNDRFTTGGMPNSRNNSGGLTPVAITDIAGGGRVMRAEFVAGEIPPDVSFFRPDTLAAGESPVTIEVRGFFFQPGAACRVSGPGVSVDAAVEWLGDNVLLTTVDTRFLPAGSFDLVVTNPDGRADTAPAPLVVRSPFSAAGARAGRSFVRLDWGVTTPGLLGCLVHRKQFGDSWRLLTPDTLRSASGEFTYIDDSVEPATLYSYRLEVVYAGGGAALLELPGPWFVPDLPFTVYPPYPNPSSGESTVRFFVPARRRVAVDVVDVSGRRVAALADRVWERGTQSIRWDAGAVSPGLYFVVFRAGDLTRAVKVVVVR